MIACPPLHPDEVDGLQADLRRAYTAACERQGQQLLRCRIGELILDLGFAGSALPQAFLPALAGIIQAADGPAGARIHVYDASASGVGTPRLERPVRDLIGWRGDCACLPTVAQHLGYNHSEQTLTLVDPRCSEAWVVIHDLSRLPVWALAAPLRTALAQLLPGFGLALVHAAAVGDANGMALLTGYGGSGKSTTALACHRQGLTVLGDDYVAVDTRPRPGRRPRVHALYASVKVVPCELRGETPSASTGGKAVLYPLAGSHGPVLQSAPLMGFHRLRLGTGPACHWQAAHPDDVARIAAASSNLQLPTGDDAGLEQRLRNLAHAIGNSAELWLGSDRRQVPAAVREGLRPRQQAGQGGNGRPPRGDGRSRPVSVIIPVYNAGARLADAVASIVRQGRTGLQLIIVDDGSTEPLDAVLEHLPLPVQLLRQSNRGPAAARNTGLQLARHDWVAFLDADDCWEDDALARLGRDLLLHEQAGVVHGKSRLLRLDPDSGVWRESQEAERNFPCSISGGLYRRSVFDRVGGFDERLRYGEDTEWFARAGREAVMIPEVVLQVRRHDSNMTNDRAASERGMVQALHRILSRRRASRTDAGQP